ncbi:MAG TPA: polysaccharide biosynthesis tyrosine autokinase [Longimicrobium sp.]|nr:polysaccharide biosynthesis tyrosine autokinase [Longimicrobium sp.]
MSLPQRRPLALVPPENETPLLAGGEYSEYPDSVDLNEVFAVLRRHWALIAVMVLLVTTAAAFVVLRQPPQFQANALIRLKDERSAMTAGLDDPALKGLLMGRTADPLLSEIEVLKSRAVGADVVDREGLRLMLPAGFPSDLVADVAIDSGVPSDSISVRFSAQGVSARSRDGRATAAYGAPVVLGGVRFTVTANPGVDDALFRVEERELAISGFLHALAAVPREQTNVVDVSYTAGTPEQARRVVNTAITVFRDLNLRTAQEQSRRRRIFVEEQLAGSDSILAHAQMQLSDFRRRENVYSSSQKFAAEQESLQGLDVRREELAAEERMYQSLLDGVRRAPPGDPSALRALVSSPGLASNAVVTQLYGKLVQYKIARDSLTTGAFASSASNPDVQRLNALIASTTSDLVAAARSHVENVQARLTALGQLQSRTSAVIQSMPAPEAEEVRLTLQVETIRKIADQLREEYQKARVAEVVEAGQVELLAAAPLPAQPLPRHRGMKLALALVVGLLLGGAGAFLREHTNSALYSKDEVEQVFHAPVLATIPQFAVGGAGKRRRWWGRRRRARADGPVTGSRSELVTAMAPSSSGAEAYRVLRTNLIFSQAVRTLKTVVVTSCTPGEGKTTTAANVAITFAQQGLQVLLVDCDLRRARLHKLFDARRDPGLTHLVLGHNTLQEVVQPSGVEGLSLLPSGALPPNPQELLGGPRMQRTLDELASRFDMVVLDTPPLLATADAAVLAARVDGVVMVVRAGVTERAAAREVVGQLRGLDAHLLGAVLNDADDRLPAYGGYYGAYGYGTTE